MLACFGLSPMAQALLPPPPPDGGYPNGNTAEGDNALFNLTSGSQNTALGFTALGSNTTGSRNTATGFDALVLNTTGVNNTATGYEALFSNADGFGNTGIGNDSLVQNTTGDDNTAIGLNALFANTGGNNNVACGAFALQNNTTAVGNTASGFQALFNNTTGINNTAAGRQALQNNTTGSFNIGLGNLAGHNLTTGSNNIDIGNQGVAAEARTIRIGEQGNQNRTFIAGIFNSAAPGGVQVFVNSMGRIGTVVSSARFKDEIKPIDEASEAILALKPVTFRYKKDLDPERTPQFGLLAEDVEKVNPDLVARDQEEKPYTVRYEAVNAMLLNEFLKQHGTVQELKSTVAKQEATISQQKNFQTIAGQQQKQIEALTAGLQKVSAQLEANKAVPQVVVNNQ